MLPARKSYLVWTNGWLTWIFTTHNWGASRVNSLYFVEVKADGNSFYKIGITTRLIEERIAEVQRDVRANYSDVAVNLLGLWEHWGSVELYFKHHYKAFNYRIKKLTEYFVFPKVKRTLRDLFEMEAKVPSNVELDVRVRGECDRQTTT